MPRYNEPPTAAEMARDAELEEPASMQADILDEIVAEREYQDGKWGAAFDDANTVNDWAAYLGIYTGKATAITAPPAERRRQMLKVAAIAVAAVEAFDRNGCFAPRHYEDRVPKDA